MDARHLLALPHPHNWQVQLTWHYYSLTSVQIMLYLVYWFIISTCMVIYLQLCICVHNLLKAVGLMVILSMVSRIGLWLKPLFM